MKSIITEHAKQQIRQIAKYIGHEEPLLAERPVVYRSYVMNHLDKIVYRIDGDIIYFVAFWDVRRNPTTLASEVK